MVFLAALTVNVWFLIVALAALLIVFINAQSTAAQLKRTITQRETALIQKETALKDKEIEYIKKEGVFREKELLSSGLLKEKDLLIGKIQSDIKVEAHKIAEGHLAIWKQKELESQRTVIMQAALQRAQAILAEWKIEEGDKLRKDAVKRSMGVNFGKITEHLIPFSIHLQEFDPRDIRFIGSPVDLMIFDGATEKRDVIDIYFVEIKTGTGQLSKKQKTLRDAIENQRIHWKPIIVPEFKWDVPDEEEDNDEDSFSPAY
jgi:predicted Holliday junction resolvase-like endonuclease